jgi:para-nitrobenzyl esterase
MLDAWTSFARTGDPSHERLPGWTPYEPAKQTTMRLGLRCGPESAPLEALRPFWDGLQ